MVNRRGSVYIAVLGAAIFVAATGIGLMHTVRLQGVTDAAVADAAQARLCAEAGVEAVAQYITSNSNWRSRAQGAWLTNAPLGPGTVTVTVTDPDDGNLADDSSEAIRIVATGQSGAATHILRVSASPRGAAIGALSAALVTQGQLHINSGKIVNLNGGTAHTNTVLRNDGTIQGRATCQTTEGASVATLGTSTGAPALAMPSASVIDSYIARATVLTPSGSTLSKVLLTPSFNSIGGGYNHDGVYVINAAGDLTIRSIRLQGTLIINLPSGKKVTFEGPALLQPNRADFPTLLVKGDLVLKSSALVSLSESTESFNFNPVGVPYNGATDSDTLDVYPSKAEGLVHATGYIDFATAQSVIGCVISGSSLSSDAVRISDNISITPLPSLTTNPPIGYTTGGTPAIISGSWEQMVNP